MWLQSEVEENFVMGRDGKKCLPNHTEQEGNGKLYMRFCKLMEVLAFFLAETSYHLFPGFWGEGGIKIMEVE